MFTLIKREIYDHMAYFIGAIVFSLLIVLITAYVAYTVKETQEIFAISVVASAPVIIIFVLGSTAMGVSQMYIDRNRKVSAFLSTLAATREQILLARISAGILAIFLFFLPMLVTSAVIYRLFLPPITFFQSIFFDVYTVTLLTSLSCYCIGLQTGWTSGRLIPTLGGLLLACIFATIIFVKGFSGEISVLLILFIAASLVRIRHQFISTSL
jgi:hypothetical protein